MVTFPLDGKVLPSPRNYHRFTPSTAFFFVKSIHPTFSSISATSLGVFRQDGRRRLSRFQSAIRRARFVCPPYTT